MSHEQGPGLGSGALREALEWALSKIEYPMVADPLNPDRYYKGCPGCRIVWTRDIKHKDDCAYMTAVALSLSSPIEPDQFNLGWISAIEVAARTVEQSTGFSESEIAAKIRVHLDYDAARPTSQASSEVREHVYDHDVESTGRSVNHSDSCWCRRAAPSRQVAGGK